MLWSSLLNCQPHHFTVFFINYAFALVIFIYLYCVIISVYNVAGSLLVHIHSFCVFILVCIWTYVFTYLYLFILWSKHIFEITSMSLSAWFLAARQLAYSCREHIVFECWPPTVNYTYAYTHTLTRIHLYIKRSIPCQRLIQLYCHCFCATMFWLFSPLSLNFIVQQYCCYSHLMISLVKPLIYAP